MDFPDFLVAENCNVIGNGSPQPILHSMSTFASFKNRAIRVSPFSKEGESFQFT